MLPHRVIPPSKIDLTKSAVSVFGFLRSSILHSFHQTKSKKRLMRQSRTLTVVSRILLFNQLFNIGKVTDTVKGKRQDGGPHISELLSRLESGFISVSFFTGNDKGKGKARAYELDGQSGEVDVPSPSQYFPLNAKSTSSQCCPIAIFKGKGKGAASLNETTTGSEFISKSFEVHFGV